MFDFNSISDRDVYIYGAGALGVFLASHMTEIAGVQPRGIVVSDGRRGEKHNIMASNGDTINIYEISELSRSEQNKKILFLNTVDAGSESLRVLVEDRFGKDTFIDGLPVLKACLINWRSIVVKENTWTTQFTEDGRRKIILFVITEPFHHRNRGGAWVYQKSLYQAFVNNIPIVAEEHFTSLSNTIFDLMFTYKYGLLEKEENEHIKKYIIPDSIRRKLSCGSRLSGVLKLMNEPCEELETFFENVLDDISKTYSVECIWSKIICFKSIRNVAERRNIPVFSSERALRSQYRDMCYLSFDDVWDDNEIQVRYENFKKSVHEIGFPLLSRKEILLVLLDDSALVLLENFDAQPEYEIGIAAISPIATTIFAKTLYTDLELCEDISENFKQEDILFRKHPGAEPYQASYWFRNQDASPSSIAFIQRCKAIAAQGSSIMLEAMLWNKPVYTRDGSPFALYAEHDFSNHDPSVVGEEFLNFAIFAFLVPREKAWDADYMLWRLSMPSEIDIFNYHLDIYLKERGIDRSVLFCSHAQRIDRLRKIRGL